MTGFEDISIDLFFVLLDWLSLVDENAVFSFACAGKQIRVAVNAWFAAVSCRTVFGVGAVVSNKALAYFAFEPDGMVERVPVEERADGVRIVLRSMGMVLIATRVRREDYLNLGDVNLSFWSLHGKSVLEGYLVSNLIEKRVNGLKKYR